MDSNGHPLNTTVDPLPGIDDLTPPDDLPPLDYLSDDDLPPLTGDNLSNPDDDGPIPAPIKQNKGDKVVPQVGDPTVGSHSSAGSSADYREGDAVEAGKPIVANSGYSSIIVIPDLRAGDLSTLSKSCLLIFSISNLILN